MRSVKTSLGSPRKTAFDPSTLLKFVMSGASTALLFLVLCFAFTKAGADPFAASLAAYALAFVVGYALQRWWTFDARHRHGRALPRYAVLQVGCALLSGVVSRVGADRFGLSPLPMATVTAGVAGAVSFVVSRYWVFPHGRSDSDHPL